MFPFLWRVVVYRFARYHSRCCFCTGLGSISSHSSPFLLISVYSSDDDDEETELNGLDFDVPVTKNGKRSVGKTRWTREEVRKGSNGLLLGLYYNIRNGYTKVFYYTSTWYFVCLWWGCINIEEVARFCVSLPKPFVLFHLAWSIAIHCCHCQHFWLLSP